MGGRARTKSGGTRQTAAGLREGAAGSWSAWASRLPYRTGRGTPLGTAPHRAEKASKSLNTIISCTKHAMDSCPGHEWQTARNPTTFLARLAFLRQDAPGAGTPHLPTKRARLHVFREFSAADKKILQFFSFSLPETCSHFLLLIPLKEAQVQRHQPLTEHKDPLKVPR